MAPRKVAANVKNMMIVMIANMLFKSRVNALLSVGKMGCRLKSMKLHNLLQVLEKSVQHGPQIT